MALLLFLTARVYELCAPQEATTAIGGGSTAPNSEAAQTSTSTTTAPEVGASATNTTGVAGAETVSPQQQLRQLILQLKDTEAPLVGPRLHPNKASAYRDFFLEEDLFGFGFDANVTLEGTIIEFLQVLSSQIQPKSEQSFSPECSAFVPSNSAVTNASAGTGAGASYC